GFWRGRGHLRHRHAEDRAGPRHRVPPDRGTQPAPRECADAEALWREQPRPQDPDHPQRITPEPDHRRPDQGARRGLGRAGAGRAGPRTCEVPGRNGPGLFATRWLRLGYRSPAATGSLTPRTPRVFDGWSVADP